jgi:hypothetical protein
MPEIVSPFITSHAVEQFQKRISPLGDDAALAVIRAGIEQATNIRVLPDGNTWRIRTRRPFPFEFRAVCVMDAERGSPVVVTILRGDSKVMRKLRRRTQTRWEHL